MKHTILLASLFLSTGHVTHAMEITPIKNKPSYQTLQCREGILKRDVQQIITNLNNGADVNYIDHNGSSLFLLACAAGNSEIMSAFITHKDIDLMARNAMCFSPLHLACQLNLSETVESMLNKNSQLATLRSKKGNTPLIIASQHKHEKCISALMRYYTKDSINIQNYDGSTALHLACEHKQYNIIKELILHGADITIKNIHQATPLSILGSWLNDRHRDSLYSFLAENQDNGIAHQLIHATDANGNTQFHLCAMFQEIDPRYLQFLTSQGLDMHALNKDGKTAVDLAKQKYTQLCNFYITNKLPDIYQIVARQELIINAFSYLTNKEYTIFTHPLQHTYKNLPEDLHDMEITQISSAPSAETVQCIEAIKRGNMRQLTDSLNAGANVNHIDNNSESLFYLACLTNTEYIMWPFVTHPDIDPMARSLTGDTPLHLACKFGLTETVKLILSKNPTLTTLRNKNGETPLMLASHYEQEECADLLIPHCNESTINAQNHDGSTALHCACHNRQYDIIKKLILHGARATIRDNNQTTPLATIYNCSPFYVFLTTKGDVARKLIHATDADGNTQFHLCATSQCINVTGANSYLLFLLLHGLKIDTINNNGKRAVDLAEQEYKQLYNFYKIDKYPEIYKVLVKQERLMHAFLRHTPPHAFYASLALTEIVKKCHVNGIPLPQELLRIIWHLYYALNIETIIAKKYYQSDYYNDFIENKDEIKNQLLENPEPKLLWNAL